MIGFRHEGVKADAEAAEGNGAVDAAATGSVQAEALKL
jgi:hypothetical protein